MNRISAILFALWFCAPAFAQSTKHPLDAQTFELTPAALPVPALKYELHYDLAIDRLPGNAAQLYQDAILIMGPDLGDKAEKAIDAYEAHDTKTFHSLADEIDKPALYQELDLAARRETCNFEPPFTQMGNNTPLPHLEPILHGVARWIEVRGLRQIDQGKYDDAIKTLRMGYELAEQIGKEPTVVSGLVSLRITEFMNEALIALMNRPDAPNLYFALCEFPSRQEVFHHTMYGNREVLVLDMPDLAKVFAGEELTSQQWHDLMATATKMNEQWDINPIKHDYQPEKTLEAARADYAQHHDLTADQIKTVDSVVVLGEFYALHAQIVSDDLFKWRGLPYPLAIAKEHESFMKAQLPGNPFMDMYEIGKTTASFARVDRQTAALTIVEAIRSYSAANGGKLPSSLDEITETPAPIDPATGKPFEYRVENNSAVLSSTALDAPLKYTIGIRR